MTKPSTRQLHLNLIAFLLFSCLSIKVFAVDPQIISPVGPRISENEAEPLGEGALVTFRWTHPPEADVQDWAFYVGSAPGKWDYQRITHMNRYHFVVPELPEQEALKIGIPADGRTIYVRFFWRTPEHDFQFTDLEYITPQFNTGEGGANCDDSLGDSCNDNSFVNFDYDGDGRADIGVWRPSNQFWYISNSSGSQYNSEQQDAIQRTQFGSSDSDIPVSGDFDGDNIADFAIRQSSTGFWYIRNSSGTDPLTGNDDGISRRRFGMREEDIPVPADYDGDGKTDLAVRRPSTQYWYILNSTGVDTMTNNDDGITRIRFGLQADDIPVPADYDGDGKADLAVRRPASQFWYIRNSSGVDPITQQQDGITRVQFGRQQNDVPVVADYDGDGKADLAVRRPSTQFWYILNSAGVDLLSNFGDGISRVRFGSQQSDIPIPADYDGDGRADLAVRRPATYIQYIKNSSGVDDSQADGGDGITRKTFGRNASDIPLGASSLIQMGLLKND